MLGVELLTTSEMTEADRLTIAAGVPGIDLMEAAGRAVAYQAMHMAPSGGRIIVACGPGNNGGDGFIAARLLMESRYKVDLVLLGEIDALKGDARRAAQKWTGKIIPLENFDIGTDSTTDITLIIDALFGAGLMRDVEGEAARFIDQINQSETAVLSVDVPSGIDGNSGKVRGAAIKATKTVTFFRAKPGHLLMPGRVHCGALITSYIGIRPGVLQEIKPKRWANGPGLWLHSFPAPTLNDHKYDRGHALVISGGMTTSGAARLAARGALRAGAGLVTMASPKSAIMVNAMHLNAIMLMPFDGPDGLIDILADTRKNACLIGPGCGAGDTTRRQATRDNVQAILNTDCATVLDADALTSFAGREQELFGAIKKNPSRPVVLTPHDGEFARLFTAMNENGNTKDLSKLDQGALAARRSGATIILKGADTVIASPDGRCAINENAPPELATAGSGDVLAGILLGLLAQKMPPFEAASAAVWLHGAAGALLGRGLIAEDLPEILPKVLQNLGPSSLPRHNSDDQK